MESQPQNPEFRNNPENFHPCRHHLKKADTNVRFCFSRYELLLSIMGSRKEISCCFQSALVSI